MNPKPLFKSRTVLFNLLMSLSLLIPSAAWRDFITNNPEAIIAVITLTNVALRVITKQAVVLVPDTDMTDGMGRKL